MRLFTTLYDRVMLWSKHPHASRYLAGLSFAESSFFPVPPDVMLAPMAVARPEAWWRLAWITTLASVAGGLLGYLIGVFAIELIEPLIHELGYSEKYALAKAWFAEWGFWAVFLAGFSPIPYKLFTITAGALSLALLPFVLASLVGRGIRFLLVALLMAKLGPPMEAKVRVYLEWLGWGLVGLALLAYALLRG